MDLEKQECVNKPRTYALKKYYNLPGHKLKFLNDFNMTALIFITVCMLVFVRFYDIEIVTNFPQMRALIVILKSTEVMYLHTYQLCGVRQAT